MRTCVECGCEFKKKDAKRMVKEEFNGEIDWEDDGYSAFCGDCAIDAINSDIRAGEIALTGDFDD